MERAESSGLAAIAIADHDTVSAHLRLAGNIPDEIRLIPAIEMSANVGNAEVHILGYFINTVSSYLREQLSQLQEQRLSRIERFCTRLTSLGLPLGMEDVLRHATGQSIGRPHIARAMIERGYVSSVGEAFERYLSGGRPAFVPREDVTPESSIALIHAAGGVAVLAHPYTTGSPERTIQRLLPLGLDGMEVEYGVYDPVQRSYLRSLSERYKLIATGGSDYHGAEHREDAPLGLGSVGLDVVCELEETAQRYS